jgi:hypothetical protein
MNKDSIINDFDDLAIAKRKNTGIMKMIIAFSAFIIVASMVWTFTIVNTAMEKIIVVDRSGEYLKTSIESNEKLFYSLLTNQCALTAFYVNSFDKLSINENQSWASFMATKDDLNRIYAKYNQERAYGDVIDRGVVYKCKFNEIEQISGKSEPYHVVFTSVLSIVDGTYTKKILIRSQGDLIRHTPHYPENVTGLYFTSYTQDYEEIKEDSTSENSENISK